VRSSGLRLCSSLIYDEKIILLSENGVIDLYSYDISSEAKAVLLELEGQQKSEESLKAETFSGGVFPRDKAHDICLSSVLDITRILHDFDDSGPPRIPLPGGNSRKAALVRKTSPCLSVLFSGKLVASAGWLDGSIIVREIDKFSRERANNLCNLRRHHRHRRYETVHQFKDFEAFSSPPLPCSTYTTRCNRYSQSSCGHYWDWRRR
jgi:hypothetical protein